MKKNLLLAVFLLSLLGCVFQKPTIDLGDENSSVPPTVALTSMHGTTRSHAPGQDCLNCHQPNRGSELWFTLAGTVYSSSGNQTISGGLIELYDQPHGQGTMITSIEVDAKGNFYTTKALTLSDSIYVKLINADETVRFKPGALAGGSCNRCHGPETNRIGAD